MKSGTLKTLKTPEMVAANDTAVQDANDKRQLTALVSAAASGAVLEAQLVVEGKTAESLPQFAAPFRWQQTHSGINDKQSKQAKTPQATRAVLCLLAAPLSLVLHHAAAQATTGVMT